MRRVATDVGASSRSGVSPFLAAAVSAKKRTGKGTIAIEDLSVEFRRNGSAFIAVNDVDVTIAPGEFTALLGPSGCGKSTLLNAIGGMAQPARGRVSIDGVTVAAPSAICGVVFQQHSLFPWMTARDNVAF